MPVRRICFVRDRAGCFFWCLISVFAITYKSTFLFLIPKRSGILTEWVKPHCVTGEHGLVGSMAHLLN